MIVYENYGTFIKKNLGGGTVLYHSQNNNNWSLKRDGSRGPPRKLLNFKTEKKTLAIGSALNGSYTAVTSLINQSIIIIILSLFSNTEILETRSLLKHLLV